ncbi:MAG: hypothetical protein NTX53_01645 [candidate division WOR-3 bacterium]|nr:hypothetical protein [candidate division WOR-3 bacterium]
MTKVTGPGDYLVAVCLRIPKGDPAFDAVEVGHGAFWSEENVEFSYSGEQTGLRIGKNGQRFAPKSVSDLQDPFAADDCRGVYIHHLGDEILYFRIYSVTVVKGAESSVVCRFDKRAGVTTSGPSGSGSGGGIRGMHDAPGAKGSLNGFSVKRPHWG